MKLRIFQPCGPSLRGIAAFAFASLLLRAAFALAQDVPMPASAPASTNQAMAAEDQNTSSDAEPADPTPAEASATNSVSATPDPDVNRTTASTQPSGRESRARRLRNRRSDQSGGDLSATAASTNSGPASLEYSAFETIARKNIFDPNRRSSNGRRAPGRAPRIDSFGLVGTMTYEKGTFAFFNGSSFQYQKALHLADEIAGYKVTAVLANSVKLAQGTNEIELRVGSQLRREDEGPWELSANSASYGASASGLAAPPASSGSAPVASTPPPSGPQSDILKRLMQRREQE